MQFNTLIINLLCFSLLGCSQTVSDGEMASHFKEHESTFEELKLHLINNKELFTLLSFPTQDIGQFFEKSYIERSVDIRDSLLCVIGGEDARLFENEGQVWIYIKYSNINTLFTTCEKKYFYSENISDLDLVSTGEGDLYDLVKKNPVDGATLYKQIKGNWYICLMYFEP